MEVFEAIRSRRSIRKFKPDPVPDAYLKQLLEAARMAPSGTNIQPWRFIVIRSAESRERLSSCTPLAFVAKAPVVIACCMDVQALDARGRRAVELKEAGAFAGTVLDSTISGSNYRSRSMDEAQAQAYLSLNTAIAIDHITLRAVDLGLGTCWVMMFDREKLRELLELEDRYRVLALLPVGYPDQDPPSRPRLSVEEILLKEI